MKKKKVDKFVATIMVGIGIVFSVYALFTDEINKIIDKEPIVVEADHQIVFPSSKYPETAEHIKEAIANGESRICTIDRDGAEENRKLSLKGIPTKKGFDRDEWPMAMCEEGGEGADIKYISSSDNRGAGSWVGNQLEDLPNGTKVEIIVK